MQSCLPTAWVSTLYRGYEIRDKYVITNIIIHSCFKFAIELLHVKPMVFDD